MEIKRVFDILDQLKTSSSKRDILNAREKGPDGGKTWVSHSVDAFAARVDEVSAGLLALGLKKNDMIAIMSNNRPEWIFVDYGAQQVAMPTVPIYPTINAADLRFILEHAAAKVIFISEKSIYQKIMSMIGELPQLMHIYSFTHIEGVKHFSELLSLGKVKLPAAELDRLKASVSEDDMFTVLYTSGTTGHPKGVMISHKGLLSNVKALQRLAPISSHWRALSFLPLNHVYERVLNTLYLFKGVSIYYAESIETIAENSREIRPQIFVSVPRIFERTLEKLYAAGDQLRGLKKWIYFRAIKLAEIYEPAGRNGLWYEMQRMICDIFVYRKWRRQFGGEIVCIVSGGAALNPKIERIFCCADLLLLQGYGLTETSVAIAANSFGKGNMMAGTVGPVLENVEVKISPDDGEILMRGDSLMMGYYKNPEATAESIDSEGWFHTGDVGVMLEGKFLKITDRKKELFKTSAGKYISPAAIENKLKECKFIEQCMVVGDGQKFASALIVPNLSGFKEYCGANGLAFESGDLLAHPALNQLINEHIRQVNLVHAPYEQLKRCKLINASWTVESGEMTPKLSLKRKVIGERNKAALEEIFGA